MVDFQSLNSFYYTVNGNKAYSWEMQQFAYLWLHAGEDFKKDLMNSAVKLRIKYGAKRGY